MIIPLERFLPIVDKAGMPTLRLSSFLEELVRVGDSREIGATNEPAFENSWINFDSATTETAGFYIDNFDRVYLKGSVKAGASGTAIFTLPVNYRPPLKTFVSGDGVSTGGGSGDTNLRIEINTDGTVVPIFSGGGTSTRTSIDGISFRV